MATSSTVLREYLLSLGFKVDTQQAKKFDGTILGIEKSANAAGKAVAVVGGTVAAFATVYANSMERLYFASRSSGSTVKQLQALEYAGEKVGISAGEMEGAIQGMASSLRNNPGLTGFLRQLGVKTEGRSPAQEMLDLVAATKNMPYMQGARYAERFGMGEGTYQKLRQNLDVIREQAAVREKMDKDAGVDPDKVAEEMNEALNNVRDMKAEFTLMEGVIAQHLIAPMRAARKIVGDISADWIRIIQNKGGAGSDIKNRLLEAAGIAPVGGGVKLSNDPRYGSEHAHDHDILTDQAQETLDRWRRGIIDWRFGSGASQQRLGASRFAANNPAGTAPSAGAATPATSGPMSQQQIQDMFSNYEDAYGLPAGALDNVWRVESNRGKEHALRHWRGRPFPDHRQESQAPRHHRSKRLDARGRRRCTDAARKHAWRPFL